MIPSSSKLALSYERLLIAMLSGVMMAEGLIMILLAFGVLHVSEPELAQMVVIGPIMFGLGFVVYIWIAYTIRKEISE